MTAAPRHGAPRVLLDANVLFPTVLREILIGVAETGAYRPVWSPRILEEWARATRRLRDGAEAIARAEIAILRDEWPRAEVTPTDELIAGITLPDPDDAHVLAAAIAGGADTLLTLNRADFPNRLLAPYGVIPRDPDGFLTELAEARADVAQVLEAVRARTEAIAGRRIELRPLLKRAGLPRLGRLLG